MLLSTGLIGLHHHLTFQSLFHSLQVCYPLPCQLYDWSLYKLLHFLHSYPTLHYTQTNTYTHVRTYIHVHTDTDKQIANIIIYQFSCCSGTVVVKDLLLVVAEWHAPVACKLSNSLHGIASATVQCCHGYMLVTVDTFPMSKHQLPQLDWNLVDYEK